MSVYTNQLNISAMERLAVNKLRKTRKIVIKSTDKGERCIREAHRQLNNPKYNKKLDKSNWFENCRTFNTIIFCLKDKNQIHKKQTKTKTKNKQNILKPSLKSQTRKRYLQVNTWTNINKPPDRSIISDCGPSRNISEYIDSHLKSIAQRHEHFMKNIAYFLLSKLSNQKTFDKYPNSDKNINGKGFELTGEMYQHNTGVVLLWVTL